MISTLEQAMAYSSENPSPMLTALSEGMVDICKPFPVRYTLEIIEPSPWALKVVIANDIARVKAHFTYHRDELTDMPGSQLAYPLLRRYKQAHEAAYIPPESNIDLGYN